MKLAILVTNTDDSEFARTHADDGEKFTALVQERRPDWQTEVFWVRDGDFPEDFSTFDGAMITGSPASVRGDEAWIGRLLDMIRQMDAARFPVFGACFGHQAVAMALGGEVGDNPGGWVHGYVEVTRAAPLPWAEVPERMGLYASHSEQVLRAPERAQIVARGPGCGVGGFVIGDHIFTTQYHPEMSDAFIADLVEHTAGYVGPEVTARARESLKNRADREVIAEIIARFFEWSVARREA
ncbi:GMP synthase-Glutamine amidotransferase [Salinihabitans flavidus]|uniref:GMP synthase-Glutamine amidotransferase n=1 Tax=Salinihabitans flavidus TaxID=569882 RepID=A0A1H8ST55_9RHOB|nr:type 1 glutamine amidotransferase [Salinihabitans flavidus]SEO81353.1 GMP synthase-Glutamine amidotransferase [Salinihabitans flavidus]